MLSDLLVCQFEQRLDVFTSAAGDGSSVFGREAQLQLRYQF